MKHVKFLWSILLLSSPVLSQTVHLDFPHFAGKDYVYFLIRADQNDTIQKGALDSEGQAVLTIPKSYADYKGQSLFRLAEGGGLDIILNNEKEITIRCLDEHPNDENIDYAGSPENVFIRQSYQNRQSLLNKASVAQAVVEIYPPEDSLSIAFRKEIQRLETAYAALCVETNQSSLWAARLWNIYNFLRGFTCRLNPPEKEALQDLIDFAVNRMDMEALYTSGVWNASLQQWMDLELKSDSDAVLLQHTQTILSRTSRSCSKEIYKALLSKVIALYTQSGKEYLLTELEIDHLLEAGNQAPALVNKGVSSTPAQTVIVFHESSCSNCESELMQIIGNYSIIKKKGYDVISVSADKDSTVFETHAQKFPWKEKICDLEGFDGVNFKNYFVFGTPTILIIDKEGKIEGRYSRLADTNLIR
ncbi:MAG: thioredoxin family protein [Candidatus Azobacteroides sp.]|nr:thioredoxin family protein [Candidatus Azobacteroides sp.]